MFGYVLPSGSLPREERERFGRMYCGLCHTLRRRYGTAARWILNYDFTFLAILLSGGEEGESVLERCPVHPLRPRLCHPSSAAVALAADESVILAWYQLRDGVEDEWFSLPWRAASAVLRPARDRAAEARPDFDAAVQDRLQELHMLEQERCPSLDRPADAFARLLQSAAPETADRAEGRILGELLYHMGRWIYLIDAADDLKRDAASGRYNPAALRYGLTDGVWTDGAKEAFAVTLDHSVHAMAAALELREWGVWRPILESVVYQGLFETGRAVLDGTFRRGRPGKLPGKVGDTR